MEGHIGVFSVDFRSRRNEDTLTLPASSLEHHLSAVYICFDRSNRTLHDQLDAHRCSHVEDDIGLIHQFRQQLAIFQGLKKIMHSVIFLQMADIFHATRRKIVHEQDFISTFKQPFRKMRSHKTCTTCNQINHFWSSFPSNPDPVAILNSRTTGISETSCPLLPGHNCRKNKDSTDTSNNSHAH